MTQNKSWQEIIKNEIWVSRNYLPIENFLSVRDLIKKSRSENLAPESVDLDGLHAAGVNPTNYRYLVHHVDFSQVQGLQGFVLDPISSFLNRHIDTSRLNALNLFAKSFDKDGFYALHSELPDTYGDYAFVLFLTNEVNWPLIFPSADQVAAHLEKTPEDIKRWEQTKSIFDSNSNLIRTIGPALIYPEENSLVLFKTGSAHFVEKIMSPQSSNGRLSLTGWPFVKDSLIDNLSNHSDFKRRFEGF